MWVIIVVVVVVVVVASTLAGERENTNSGNSGGVDQDGQKCEGCNRSKAWWNSLSRWKKIAYSAWYVYKKTQCNASGCSF
jgi:hypothetical protein